MIIDNYSVNLEKGEKVIFKIGTSAIEDSSNKEHGLNERVIDSLGAGIRALHDKGIESIIVSSGARSAGEHNFGFEADDKDVLMQQVVCGAGDYIVSYVFNRIFSKYNMRIIQGLITHKELEGAEDRENLRNVLEQANHLPAKIGILKYNENDLINSEEVKTLYKDRGGKYHIGDNDRLTYLICMLHKANLAVSVSDIDGVYNKDPKIYPDAQIIKVIDNDISFETFDSGKRVMKGGIKSKYNSLRDLAQENVCGMIINAKYLSDKGSVQKILSGEIDRTLFMPKNKKIIILN